jgi:hypothetical protein
MRKVLCTLTSTAALLFVRSASAQEPRPAEDAARETAPDAPPQEQNSVMLSIDSSHDATRLERFRGSGSGSQVVYVGGQLTPVNTSVQFFDGECIAPCRKRVDLNQRYRVDAPGMSSSSLFVMPPGTTALKVNGGSQVAQMSGAVLTGGGIGLTLIGGVVLPLAMASREPSTPLVGIGATMLSVGLVSLTVGIILWATSGTSVYTQSGKAIAAFAGNGWSQL